MPESLMKAARLHEVGKPFQIDELPVPAPRPTDVLVKVETAGMVQNLRNVISNYAVTRPNRPLPRLPAVFGLDSAGVVASVGSMVKADVKVGDRVYVNPGLSCGSCLACRRGDPTCCPAYTFMGYFGFGPDSQEQFDAYPYGGFGEFLTAPVGNLVKLPGSVTFEQAARFGYLGTSFSALRKLNFSPGQTLLVDGGTGTLGVGTVLLALAMGASAIFATGRDKARLARLAALDADRVIVVDGSDGSVMQQVFAGTRGLGVDAVVQALAFGAPASNFLESYNSLRRGGKLVNIGGTTEPVEILPAALMGLQKSVIGSLWFTTGECEEMAAMAGSGVLRLDVFEHQSFPLEAINDALDALDARAGGFTNVIIRHD